MQFAIRRWDPRLEPALPEIPKAEWSEGCFVLADGRLYQYVAETMEPGVEETAPPPKGWPNAGLTKIRTYRSTRGKADKREYLVRFTLFFMLLFGAGIYPLSKRPYLLAA